MSSRDFESTYLTQDEDADMVLKDLPCTFLGPDNLCKIYDVRPKACKEYPHTDRRRQKQIWRLHEKNLEICPAVQRIFEELTSM